MNHSTHSTSALRTVGALALAAALLASPALAQKIGKMSTPTIACGDTTATEIEIIFTAGVPTGAPAGFSLQWMTLADWTANGQDWFLSSDPNLCKGSFSGNANGHFYNLPSGSGTTILIGDILFDNPGASSNCLDPLKCETEYIFRAFSHANRSLTRSEFTPNLISSQPHLVCKTKKCVGTEACTRTQGYWKTHGPIPKGNNSNEWPPSAIPMTLGTTESYSALELLQILETPAPGNGSCKIKGDPNANGLLTLAHQLIAAELNVANGADNSLVAGDIAAAHTLIGSLVIPPIGSGCLTPSATSSLASRLDLYNNGGLGPKHCKDPDDD